MAESKTVPFEEDAVKQHLDKCIRHWRKRASNRNLAAYFYIDAYQSVRISLFGEPLPKEEG